ncbi:MAG: hypothetical protein ACRCTD_07605, partial [Beijerinckiaceae bacterium]
RVAAAKVAVLKKRFMVVVPWGRGCLIASGVRGPCRTPAQAEVRWRTLKDGMAVTGCKMRSVRA